ncbi:unnamed protein product, partial [Linum perenne]
SEQISVTICSVCAERPFGEYSPSESCGVDTDKKLWCGSAAEDLKQCVQKVITCGTKVQVVRCA